MGSPSFKIIDMKKTVEIIKAIGGYNVALLFVWCICAVWSDDYFFWTRMIITSLIIIFFAGLIDKVFGDDT